MMTSTPPKDLEFLGMRSLQPVFAAPGPFITIFLPARHPQQQRAGGEGDRIQRSDSGE